MTQDNTGGPAFPVLVSKNPAIEYCDSGMTMRDYYKAHAPVSIEYAMQVAGCYPKMTASDRPAMWSVMAVMREEYADAMLKAREVSK